MEKLSDDLLIEIFCRLPSKFAVRCKSISKSFLALISQQSFIERCIHHHHTFFQLMKEEDGEEELENQWQFHSLSNHKILTLFQPNNNDDTSNIIPHLLDEQESWWRRLKSSIIEGCSNDLILCRRKKCIDKTYFVFNPITKQCLQLPSPPSSSCGVRILHDRFEGFICKPNYHHMKGNELNIIHRYRFKVVLFPLHYKRGYRVGKYGGFTRSEFKMMVFCSETGQWNTKVVSCRNGSRFEQEERHVSDAVDHGGKLYLLGKGNLLVYDPFDKDGVECDVIQFPSDSYPFDASSTCCHIGVSCGNIRLCAVSPLQVNQKNVSVWELEPESRCWSLVHSCVVHERELGMRRSVESGRVKVMAIHPHHGDVVLLQCGRTLCFWNMKTNKFRSAGVGYDNLKVISIDFPWWPTPILSIVGL